LPHRRAHCRNQRPRPRHDGQQGGFSSRNRLRNNLLGRPELLGKLGSPLAPVANAVFNSSVGGWFAEKLFGIAAAAPLPKFTRESFKGWVKNHKPPATATRKVVYFTGCSTEAYEPRVGRAAIHVLEANGFEVLVPEQNCCGLPLLSNGEFKAAWDYHQSNIDKLISYVKAGYVIVGTSTSCTLTLKEEAPELLDFYTDDARLLAANTYDINEFLVLMWEEGAVETATSCAPFPDAALPSALPVRAHRVGRPSVEMMSIIPELTIIESQAACCGVAGTYGYKEEKYQIAMDVGKPLFDFVAM
jgi:glycerol-3-phosphate dehydrogenase subunit C